MTTASTLTRSNARGHRLSWSRQSPSKPDRRRAHAIPAPAVASVGRSPIQRHRRGRLRRRVPVRSNGDRRASGTRAGADHLCRICEQDPRTGSPARMDGGQRTIARTRRGREASSRQRITDPPATHLRAFCPQRGVGPARSQNAAILSVPARRAAAGPLALLPILGTVARPSGCDCGASSRAADRWKSILPFDRGPGIPRPRLRSGRGTMAVSNVKLVTCSTETALPERPPFQSRLRGGVRSSPGRAVARFLERHQLRRATPPMTTRPSSSFAASMTCCWRGGRRPH
jgi:hypothetical protein